jgi:hypothetical protein
MSLGLKVTAEVKDRLDRAARANGRTQSQEAEVRLQRSFEHEDLLGDALTLSYGRELGGLVFLTGKGMQMAGRRAMLNISTKAEAWLDWLNNPYAYDQAVKAANLILEAARPAGDPAPPLDEDSPEREQEPRWPASRVNRIRRGLGAFCAREILAWVSGRYKDSPAWASEIETARKLLGQMASRLSVPRIEGQQDDER